MFLRCLIVLTLTLGLIFPKAGWLVAHWAFGVQTMVICTGSDVITITLDADGNPVQTSDTQHHACTLGKSDAAPSAPVVLAQPSSNALVTAPGLAPETLHSRRSVLLNRARAPPLT